MFKFSKYCLFILCNVCLSFNVFSIPILIDSTKNTNSNRDFNTDLTNIFIYDFFTSFSLLNFQNAIDNEQKNQLNFYYSGTINNTLKAKKFTYKLFLFNEYGFKHFIDSTTIKNQDAFTVRNTMQIPFLHRSLLFNIAFDIKSQLWHAYNVRQSLSGNTERYLYTDYFSPGYKIFSMGLSFITKHAINIDLGIVGGKITKIRNDNLYETRKSTILYGVERGEVKKTDFGINIAINAPMRNLKSNIAWECNAIIFALKSDVFVLNAYTFDITNAFHFLFLKHLRLSVRSQIKYDKNIQSSIYSMNTFTLGFYINNKL
jgi:hypothetical protein